MSFIITHWRPVVSRTRPRRYASATRPRKFPIVLGSAARPSKPSVRGPGERMRSPPRTGMGSLASAVSARAGDAGITPAMSAATSRSGRTALGCSISLSFPRAPERRLPRRAVVPPQLLRLPPRDVVAHARSVPAAVEAGGGLEQSAVVGGDALVLAEVLEPGLDDEHLEPPVRVLGVAVDAPANGAVAAADRLEPPYGAQELLGPG